MSEYPEHDRLEAIKDESQAIGEFLEFGPGRLCEWNEDTEEFLPIYGPIETILAGYFDIDLVKIEAEKRAMLDKMRADSVIGGHDTILFVDP
jgi:hypothetical protein